MGWFFGAKKEECPFKEECLTRDTKYQYTRKMEFGKKSHASFGEIHVAKVRGKDKSDVIIKVQDIGSPDKERIFWNEVMLLNRLTQKAPELGPGFIDAWVCGNRGYIAMENWLEGFQGGSLNEFKIRFNAMSEQNQISMVLFLLQLYKLLHFKARIFHDDVRHPNILFRNEGSKIKFAIIDFGLSEDLTNTDEYPTKKDIMKSALHDYIKIIQLFLEMGGKTTKYIDFIYKKKKARTYCVMSNKLDDLNPQIKAFITQVMTEYSPKLNQDDFFKKQVDKVNASDIRRQYVKPGPCKQVTREQPAKKDKDVEEAAQKLGID